jgi:hypothetical protein
MNSVGRASALQGLAARVREDSFFLGAFLSDYQAAHAMTDADLAALLRCDEGTLTRLSLCRTPRTDLPSFRNDVSQIAAFAPCDGERLARLLREVDAVQSLRRAGDGCSQESILRAARDRRESGGDTRNHRESRREPGEPPETPE